MYSYNLHASFFILLLIFQQTQIFSCHDCYYADSTVLAYVLSELNHRHKYCLDLFLLSVDEGITGYRDDSLETVKRNEIQYGLPLKIISYKDLYGWTMDDIVKAIGLKNNCTFCGVFRRQVILTCLFGAIFY
jgi:tRNA(Ile)-lysidine synthase TilS/MesJ